MKLQDQRRMSSRALGPVGELRWTCAGFARHPGCVGANLCCSGRLYTDHTDALQERHSGRQSLCCCARWGALQSGLPRCIKHGESTSLCQQPCQTSHLVMLKCCCPASARAHLQANAMQACQNQRKPAGSLCQELLHVNGRTPHQGMQWVTS